MRRCRRDYAARLGPISERPSTDTAAYATTTSIPKAAKASAPCSSAMPWRWCADTPRKQRRPTRNGCRNTPKPSFRSCGNRCISPAPIYPELEKLTLGFSLTKMREALGPGPCRSSRKSWAGNRPPWLAAELVDGSEPRRASSCAGKLLDGGRGGDRNVDRSDDRVRAHDRSGSARGAQGLRGQLSMRVLSKYTGQIAEARLQDLRRLDRSGCDLHAAHLVWVGRKGIEQGGTRYRADHNDRRRVRARHGRRPVPAAGQLDWRTVRRSIFASPTTSPPPTTSSAAIRARRS